MPPLWGYCPKCGKRQELSICLNCPGEPSQTIKLYPMTPPPKKYV